MRFLNVSGLVLLSLATLSRVRRKGLNPGFKFSRFLAIADSRDSGFDAFLIARQKCLEHFHQRGPADIPHPLQFANSGEGNRPIIPQRLLLQGSDFGLIIFRSRSR